VVSPIVTRGYGSSSRIITRGYGAVFIPAVAEAVRRTIGGTKRKVEKYHENVREFTVRAILLAVNGVDLTDSKSGVSSHEITETNTRISATFKAINRLGYLTERIIINAFRVVRRGFKKIED